MGGVLPGAHQFTHQDVGVHLYLLGRNAVQLVVFLLFGAAAGRFPDGLIHALGHGVGIHDDQAVDVAGGAAGGLRESAAAAQEPLFVGIQDGHQGHRGDVQAFAQQVYADEHVEEAVLEILDDFYTLGGIHVGMDVAAAHAVTGEVAVQFLGHALGEGGHQHALVYLGPLADFFHQVVHLVFGGTHLHGRVQQSGGTHNLLHHQTFALFQLVIGRSGAYIHRLVRHSLEFVEGEGAVVGGGGQAEAVFHQGFLAGMVPAVHGADLRKGDMALVDEYQEILREIVDEGEGPLAGLPAVEVAGIVLHAGAVAHLLDHLHVIFHALFQAFGFQELADGFEVLHLLHQVLLDLAHRPGALFLGRDEVLGGIQVNLFHLLEDGPAHGVYEGDAVHLVPEEFDAGGVIGPSQENVHGISPHAERAALEIRFRPVIQRIHDFIQETGHAHLFALADGYRLVMEVVRIANSVEAGNGADHDDVPAAAHQGRCGAHAKFVYLVVDGKVFFNIGIRRWDVGFRLIIVIIGYKVFYGIIREKSLEFPVQLRSQGFVVAQDEGRTLQTLNHIGHGEGLSGTRNSQ